ncbi:Putative PTS system EIIBC component YbbF [Frankliniella fusca]|uniref:PTS system EIIBC component YbbF n=1 Tax=Frankliniella fusca TaxID=407009 RepID=A0AAE1L5W2_9NEOP|nr:Putative PTS system EIIBC component YbbF [Frankliniella fusca]
MSCGSDSLSKRLLMLLDIGGAAAGAPHRGTHLPLLALSFLKPALHRHSSGAEQTPLSQPPVHLGTHTLGAPMETDSYPRRFPGNPGFVGKPETFESFPFPRGSVLTLLRDGEYPGRQVQTPGAVHWALTQPPGHCDSHTLGCVLEGACPTWHVHRSGAVQSPFRQPPRHDGTQRPNTSPTKPGLHVHTPGAVQLPPRQPSQCGAHSRPSAVGRKPSLHPNISTKQQIGMVLNGQGLRTDR